MSRITAIPVIEAGPFLKLFYRLARKPFGAVPEPLAISAHHPALLRAGAVHEFLVDKAARTLPVSVRELAVYRTATQLGCSWCVDFGTMLQLHEGLDIERLKHIDDYATSPAFSLAMLAARANGWPWLARQAAFQIKSRAASISVAMSASLKAMA